MDLGLSGKRAVVTGATRGLGRAIAARLAQEGCAVGLCARDGDAVTEAVMAEFGVVRARNSEEMLDIAHTA